MSEVDTEQRILEAAHRVFLRRGVAAARTQEIADEAGVNKALLHYYFRSKEKLADAVFLGAVTRLFPRLGQVLASPMSLREKLQAVADAEMEMLAANPFLPGYVLCELRSDPQRLSTLLYSALPVETLRTQTFVAFQQQLDAEAAAGRLRPVRAEYVLVLLMSMLIFPHAAAHMVMLITGMQEADLGTFAAWRRAEVADVLLRGLAP